MPALTAAVQWSRLQGGRRLAKAFPPTVFFLMSLLGTDALRHPPPPQKTAFVLRTCALAWKKPLHTDVRDSSKPDECVIRLAPYLRGAANVLICGDFGCRCVTAKTSQQKLGADHLLSDEIGKK